MSRALLALILLAAPLAGCLDQPPEGPDLAAKGADLTVHTDEGACPIPTSIAEETGLLEAASDAIARIFGVRQEIFEPGEIQQILNESRYVQVHFPPNTTIELPSYPAANATTFEDLYLIWNTSADVDNVLSNGGAYGTTYPMDQLEEKARAAVAQACPEAAGPMQPAPVWRPGQTWNYTLYEAEGPTPSGWVQWTVTGREPVENQSDQAYRIRELTHRVYDHDHDGEANQTEREVFHLDADTLNRVWNVCREVQGRGYFGACQGTQRTWDFPLTDGKRWSSRSHGDVIVRYEHTAEHRASFTVGNRTFEDVWVLERTREDSNRSRTVDVFDPDIDAFRYRALLRTDTQTPDQEPRVQWAWVLAEHQDGATR